MAYLELAEVEVGRRDDDVLLLAWAHVSRHKALFRTKSVQRQSKAL